MSARESGAGTELESGNHMRTDSASPHRARRQQVHATVRYSARDRKIEMLRPFGIASNVTLRPSLSTHFLGRLEHIVGEGGFEPLRAIFCK